MKLKAIESSPRNPVPDPTVPLPFSPVAQLPAFSQDIFVQDISMLKFSPRDMSRGLNFRISNLAGVFVQPRRICTGRDCFAQKLG